MTKLTVWKHPDSYASFEPDGDPVGDYLVCAQHRDSDALTRSNYTRIFADLKDAAEKAGSPECVYDFRAGHCAVGWIEYVILRRDAPAEVIALAESIAAGLEDYPVYDEDHWSELEWDEACEWWRGMSVRDRAEIIRDHGDCSIFAARRDELPDDCGVEEYLRSA